MRKISPMTEEQLVAYNLRDGGSAVSIFADTQAYRVAKARAFLGSALGHIGGRGRIVELGCSAGDISGFFSEEHEAIGWDLVPAAVKASRERYPSMTVIEGDATKAEPVDCDVLVLCEFLEHITDPEALVRAWGSRAKFMIIGHPLNDQGGVEPGHYWSFSLQDYLNWYPLVGQSMIETHLFQGPFPEMVMGIGGR